MQMKANYQNIDLFPIPTFIIDNHTFKIVYYNNKGLILTHLNAESIKKCKISDFIDKTLIKIGEFKNCKFNIDTQNYFIGNLIIQSFEKDSLIVSFDSYSKIENNSNDNLDTEGLKGHIHLTKALIDLSTDCIFIMQSGIIQYANPNLLQVSGYKLSELIGKKFTEFVSTKELEKVYSLSQKREIGANVSVKYESGAKLKNGKILDVEVSVVAIIFEGKTAFQVTLRDIAKRKIAERKYQNIIDFAPIGFYQTSKEGNFVIANNEIANILGYKNGDELISKNISEFYYTNEERKKLIGKYDTSEKSDVKNVKIKFRKKNGDPILISMTTRAIKDENYNTLYYDGFIIDNSDCKKKEDVQKLLLNLSKKSFLNISLQSYLKLIHLELKHIMKADNLYVALYDKSTDKYSFPYHIDEIDDYSITSSVYLHNTLTELVRTSKKSWFVTKSVEKELHKKYQIKRLGKPSAIWMGVPLIDTTNNEVIGVLALQDYKDENTYNKDDLQTLELIAGNAGLFIERVKNQEKLRLAKITAEEGEKRYKSLFYDNKSIMILVDPFTGQIVDANKSACDFYGYPHKQIIELKIHQINTLSENEVKLEMQKALLEKRMHFNFKHRLSNGEIRDVEAYSGKVNVNGNDLLYSVIHDVTARKLAEDKLVKLRTSIEQSPLSIIITDLKGIIEYINPYYSKLTGYSEIELLGKNPKIINSGVQSKEFYKKMWNTILGGNKWEGEMCNKKKNGELYWEQARISPIVNSLGEITHFVGIKEDITELKKHTEELIAAKEKAEESDRLKSAFLANMSHEIRTPMNGILGFTSLLLEPDLTKNTKEKYIKIIHQSGERMLNTVNDIIEISKIEAGIIEIKNSSFKIKENINNIVRFFQPQAQKKGLILYFDNEKQNLNPTIETDIRKFESILSNLIKNAIKYTDKGTITVSYSIKDEWITICVHDTGIGIPKNRQSAIFNRFEQADIEDTKVFQGSGLGLSIAKSYVEILGGNIWVESIEGKGSQFYFTVPYLFKTTENTIKK